MNGDNLRAASIAALNDALRRDMLRPGRNRVVMTRAVANLPPEAMARVLRAVSQFNSFTTGNDPHREHDFGAFDVDGVRYNWKIDYYDAALEYGSEKPEDEASTTRVLTIMRASDY